MKKQSDINKLIRKYVNVNGIAKEICKQSNCSFTQEDTNFISIGKYKLHKEQVLMSTFLSFLDMEIGCEILSVNIRRARNKRK